MHHTAKGEGEIAAVAGGEAEIGAAGCGQDDRVWTLQAMALPEPHRFQGDGVMPAGEHDPPNPGIACTTSCRHHL